MYNVSDAYGYDHNPFGVARLNDAELASRARGLSSEIGSLMRTLNRFEDFCDRIDLKALDEQTLAGVYDTACGTDWRVYEAGNELDAVELELEVTTGGGNATAETARREPAGRPQRLPVLLIRGPRAPFFIRAAPARSHRSAPSACPLLRLDRGSAGAGIEPALAPLTPVPGIWRAINDLDILRSRRVVSSVGRPHFHAGLGGWISVPRHHRRGEGKGGAVPIEEVEMTITFRIENGNGALPGKAAIITPDQLGSLRDLLAEQATRLGVRMLMPIPSAPGEGGLELEARVCPIALAVLSKCFDHDPDVIAVLDEAQHLGRRIRICHARQGGEIRIRLSLTPDTAPQLEVADADAMALLHRLSLDWNRSGVVTVTELRDRLTDRRIRRRLDADPELAPWLETLTAMAALKPIEGEHLLTWI